MSLGYIIYLPQAVEEDDLFSSICSFGGIIQKLDNGYRQVFIQNAQNEVIWISLDNSVHQNELETDERKRLQDEFALIPLTSVVVQIGMNKEKQRSIHLATEFRDKMFLLYSGAVADWTEIDGTLKNEKSK